MVGATGFLIGSDGRPSELSPVVVGAMDPVLDPPAVMALALGILWCLASVCCPLLMAHLPWFGATDLDVPLAFGRLFVGPKGHAVFSHLRA